MFHTRHIHLIHRTNVTKAVHLVAIDLIDGRNAYHATRQQQNTLAEVFKLVSSEIFLAKCCLKCAIKRSPRPNLAKFWIRSSHNLRPPLINVCCTSWQTIKEVSDGNALVVENSTVFVKFALCR